jgi:hypothetical protein
LVKQAGEFLRADQVRVIGLKNGSTPLSTLEAVKIGNMAT